MDATHDLSVSSRFDARSGNREAQRLSGRIDPGVAAHVRGLSILVAENDPGDALLIEQAFFQAGVKVPTHFVRDGQEAKDYLLGAPPFHNRSAHPMPTLLLMEWQMPRMTGFEVLAWLQRQETIRRMFVVVFSSCDDLQDSDHAYALGADSYLVKPADAGEYVEAAQYVTERWLEAYVGDWKLRIVN